MHRVTRRLIHSFRCTLLRTVPFVRHFLSVVPLSGSGSYPYRAVPKIRVIGLLRYEMTYQTRTQAQYCNVNTHQDISDFLHHYVPSSGSSNVTAACYIFAILADC
jgi:hypothetical protein